MIPRKRPSTRPLTPPGLLRRRFRANPDYRLVAHADLGEEERRTFEGLTEDTDHYGLLVPTDVPQLGVKAVGHEAARLFVDLTHAGYVPEGVVAPDEPSADWGLARLVLDGVLEVEVGGAFLTGPAARSILPPPPSRDDAPGVVARLSNEALALAMHVPVDDPATMSAWIYAHNTVPLSPDWVRRLGESPRLEETLGLDAGGRNLRLLNADFLTASDLAWQSWQRRDIAEQQDAPHRAYKLYISCHPQALIEALDEVVAVLANSDVASFKLGRGLHGVLRPDKLVMYLDSWEQLQRLAVALHERLTGMPAQGVPFTASLTDDGLLSWGMDPPPDARIPGWGQTESWRIWVTNRLARALLYARQMGTDTRDTIAYAFARLRLEGVDTDLWVPSDTLWQNGGIER